MLSNVGGLRTRQRTVVDESPDQRDVAEVRMWPASGVYDANLDSLAAIKRTYINAHDVAAM